MTDTVVTRGRELRQLVNADHLADKDLSPALLRITGLAIYRRPTAPGRDRTGALACVQCRAIPK